jgi:hypothetical protein
MSVVFPLCHLREWLSPGFAKEVGKAIEAKPDIDRTNEERLYITLTKMREYELVLALCNHAKHFEYNKEPLDDKMCQLHGASAGMMRSGDSLGITHYTVDGIEIRDIFWPVYRMYFDYFETRSPSLAASAVQHLRRANQHLVGFRPRNNLVPFTRTAPRRGDGCRAPGPTVPCWRHRRPRRLTAHVRRFSPSPNPPTLSKVSTTGAFLI